MFCMMTGYATMGVQHHVKLYIICREKDYEDPHFILQYIAQQTA